MTDFKPIRLQVSHGPNIHFEGKLVHSYSTQRADGGKDRWTELRLWETPAGNWVAEVVGCSSRGNEGEIREARVIEAQPTAALIKAERAAEARGVGPIDVVAEARAISRDDRVEQVMETFRWSTAAKAFAREMGWDVVRRVD